MDNKGFIKSNLTEIAYKGKTYPCKELTNANGDTDNLATETLLEAMGDNPDEWGDEERAVDETICYYATEGQFNATDDEICTLLHDAGCMIADYE